MTRKRTRDAGGGVSLFPCLAVLLCAMGALLLMLFALTQHAKALAQKSIAERAVTAVPAPVEVEAIEEGQWRVDMLREARDKTAAQLADKRLELSLVEDHARRISDELRRMEGDLAALEARRGDTPAASADLAALDAEIANLRAKLAALRAQNANRQGSYAILPFLSPNGTRRRPIYIECRSDCVVFQPEGIELSEKDFREPLGPGNPLASGLRAASEFLASQGHLKDTMGEPYPLLLVREDGVVSYSAARAAMKSWGAEMGYEFVPNDWRLAYPQADPLLADAIRRAVEEARRRHEAIIAAAPRLYGGGNGGGGSGTGNAFGYEPPAAVANGRGGFAGARSFAGARGEASGAESSGAAASENASALSQSEQAASRLGEYHEPPPKLTAEEREKATKSIAETRGKNWGLPESSRGATGVSRPVRIECRESLLTVHGAGGAVRQINMEGATADSVSPLVSEIWTQIETWGIAGRNMYWRPVLTLEVYPGGERRFADLKVLLADSGLEVAEKLMAPPATAAGRAPVRR